MLRFLLSLWAAVLLLSSAATATPLYQTGDLLVAEVDRIVAVDRSSGASSPVQTFAGRRIHAIEIDPAGDVLVFHREDGVLHGPQRVSRVDRFTGAVSTVVELTGVGLLPASMERIGDQLFLGSGGTSQQSYLTRLDLTTGLHDTFTSPLFFGRFGDGFFPIWAEAAGKIWLGSLLTELWTYDPNTDFMTLVETYGGVPTRGLGLHSLDRHAGQFILGHSAGLSRRLHNGDLQFFYQGDVGVSELLIGLDEVAAADGMELFRVDLTTGTRTDFYTAGNEITALVAPEPGVAVLVLVAVALCGRGVRATSQRVP